MILGGEPDKSVITYDPTTSGYSSGPDMLNGRENFGWAHFYSDAHFGRPVVLAAGGSGSKAEILDYTGTGQWTSSKFFFQWNVLLFLLISNLFVTSKIEFSNPVILQFSNLKCCIKAKEPYT